MSQLVKPTDPEWKKWLEICDYTGWSPNGYLKPMKYGKRIIPYSAELGVTPLFLNELVMRIDRVMPIRMALVGEAGASKTYTAIEIAQLIDRTFDIDQVIFKAEDYTSLQRVIAPRKAIVLEEPTFHLAARTWYKDWQRISVQTIESTRFRNNPVLIPVVNRNLIDKTVREYYLTYVVAVFDRGIARVYRTKHSQWKDILIRNTAFNIYLYSPGMDLAKCGRTTCLECSELPTCNKTIWAQYERKRAEAIDFYQRTGEKKLKEVEKTPQDKIEEKRNQLKEIIERAWEIRKELKDSQGKFSCGKVILKLGTTHAWAYLIVKELKDRELSSSYNHC